MEKIFIVGTTTGCGKTWYGLEQVSKGEKVIKPIETGLEEFDSVDESDSGQYAKAQGVELKDINLYFFNKACSPHLAAEIDNTKIDLVKLVQFIEDHPGHLIELAGGLMVPLTRDYTQLDLIKHCNGAVHLVIKNELGAINHALLTISALNDNNIPIRKIFFNNFGDEDYITEDNMKVIEEIIKHKYDKNKTTD